MSSFKKEDSLNGLLEFVPAVPKHYRINVLLKEHQCEEGHEEDEDESLMFPRGKHWGQTPPWQGLEIILQGEAEMVYS